MIYSVHFRAPRRRHSRAHAHIRFARNLEEARRIARKVLNEGAFVARICDGQRVLWNSNTVAFACMQSST